MGLGRQLGRGIGWFEEKLLAICFAIIFGFLLQQGLLSSWSWNNITFSIMDRKNCTDS